MLVCSYCSCLHMCMCLKEKLCNNTNVWYHINILVYLFREYPVSSTSGGITNNLLLSNSNNGWFYTLNWLDNPHPNKTKSITWSRHSPCCQKQIHVHGIHHSHWTIIVLLTKKNHVLHLSIKVKSNLKNHLNLCKSTGNQNINKYKVGPDTVVVPWHIYCYGNHPTTKVFANHGSLLSLASFTLSTFALTSGHLFCFLLQYSRTLNFSAVLFKGKRCVQLTLVKLAKIYIISIHT